MKFLNSLVLLVAVFIVAFFATTLANRNSPPTAGQPTPAIKPLASGYERVTSTKTLRCGYFAWPPLLRKDPNTAELSGALYDYMNALGGALGLKIEWTLEIGVGDYVEALEQNRFDALCMTIWPDPPRVANSLMTEPVFYTNVYPVARTDDNRFDSGVDAVNKPDITIAVIDGDITETLAARDFPKAKTLKLPQMSDYSQLLVSVTSKKADVTFFDYGVVHDYVKTNGKKVKVPSGFDSAYTFPEVLTVRKGEVALKQLLDTGINILNNNHVADKVLGQYVTSTFAPLANFDAEKAKAQLKNAQAKE
jgi:ABC-type amino acid transport substrate-binding protein